MAVMARNKKQDRHKPRKHIAIDPRVHEAIANMANANERPLTWEIERILRAAAEAAGFWPPKPTKE